MHLAETPAQSQMRTRLRAYFAEIMTDEVRHAFRNHYYDASANDTYRAVVRRLGQDGWLGIGWPREIGGQGLSMVEQAIFGDEATAAGVPLPLLTINSVGPAIAAHGTEVQKRTMVPAILAGCTSRSATQSLKPARTLPPFAPVPYATATTTSSTGRSCGRG